MQGRKCEVAEVRLLSNSPDLREMIMCLVLSGGHGFSLTLVSTQKKGSLSAAATSAFHMQVSLTSNQRGSNQISSLVTMLRQRSLFEVMAASSTSRNVVDKVSKTLWTHSPEHQEAPTLGGKSGLIEASNGSMRAPSVTLFSPLTD